MVAKEITSSLHRRNNLLGPALAVPWQVANRPALLPAVLPAAVYISIAATLACLRMMGRLLLGPPRQPRGHLPAAQLSGLTGIEGQQRCREGANTLALPPIRTKSPTKSPVSSANHSPHVEAAPGSPNIPAATPTPRKLNPAGAVAASTLSEPRTPDPAVAPAAMAAAAAAAAAAAGNNALRPSPLRRSSLNGVNRSASPQPSISGSADTSAPDSSVKVGGCAFLPCSLFALLLGAAVCWDLRAAAVAAAA